MKKAILIVWTIGLLFWVFWLSHAQTTGDAQTTGEMIDDPFETIDQKIQQTVTSINQASYTSQQSALDILLSWSYNHPNPEVQGVARTVLEASERKQENGTGIQKVAVLLLVRFPWPADHDISYTVDNPQKPISGNVSDIYIYPEQDDMTNLGGVIAFDGYHDMIKASFASTDNTLTINGKARSDIAKIEVIRGGDGNVQNIQNFEPGQQDFSFVIGPKEQNIRLWGNRYMIRGYAQDEIYHAIVSLIYLNPKSPSLAWEEIRKNETAPDERREKFDACYANYTWEEARQSCFGEVNQEYTINAEAACAMPDGRLNYFFQVQRPNKIPLIDHMYKNDQKIYYPLQLGTEYPWCEDSGYEVLLYYYDCATQERVKVRGTNPDEERLAKCDIQITYADDQYILTRKSPYEFHWWTFEGYELVDVQDGGVDELTLFDTIQQIGTGEEVKDIPGFANNQQVLQKITEIESIYNITDLVFGGIDYEITNVQDDRTATLRITLFAWDGIRLIYDTPIDILNRKFVIDEQNSIE